MSNLVTSSELSTIYNDYSPAFDNLYTVEIFHIGVPSTSRYQDDISTHIKFHAPSVQFGGESLSLIRNSITKKFQLSDDEFTRVDKLSITWRESDDLRVKKYHDEWLRLFYDRENDYFLSYPYNGIDKRYLYRDIEITLPHNSGDKKEKFIFSDVLPNTSPGLSLSWKNNGGIISHSLDYYVTDWKLSTVTNN